MRRSTLSLLIPMALGLAASAAWAGGPAEVGHVVAVDGLATARTPGGGARHLVCGDPVHEGERLETAGGARLVVARDGRHVHLGPRGLLVIRDAGDGRGTLSLARGHARILDGADHPGSRIETAAGVLRSEATDLELARHPDGELEVCDWSSGLRATCRRIEVGGLARTTAPEGPRLELGIRDLCVWPGRDGVDLADFAGVPPVAVASLALFDPEPDREEPGCRGDECTGEPELPGDPQISYTVAPAGSFDPTAP